MKKSFPVLLKMLLELVAVTGITFANVRHLGLKPKTECRVSVSGCSCANVPEMGGRKDTVT